MLQAPAHQGRLGRPNQPRLAREEKGHGCSVRNTLGMQPEPKATNIRGET